MPDSGVYSDSFFTMGTRCDLVLCDVDNEDGERIFQLVKNEIIHLEHQLSRFIPHSDISIMNNAEKGVWLEVSPVIWEVLTICYDFYQISNGAFDVTYAPLFSLWKNKPGNDWFPESEVEKVKEKCGFHNVEFNLDSQKIKFFADGVEFDLGAIGKGYTIDFIKGLLTKQKIKRAILNLGDSSVLALGTHPNGEKWPIGIRNAYGTDEYVHVFHSKNEVITTSANVLNSEKDAGGSRLHIINPVAGKPVEGACSVSVKSDSATFGEFLTTTWMIIPENDKNILAEKCKNVEILEIDYKSETDYSSKLTIL